MVFTDYHALKWLFNISETSGRLTRSWLRLVEFNFRVKYKKGAGNHHADALSSLLTGSPTVTHEDDDILAFHFAEENDLDISSSTITSDCSQLERQNYDQEEYFLQPKYDEYDHVLAIHDVREDEPQFSNINSEDLRSI